MYFRTFFLSLAVVTVTGCEVTRGGAGITTSGKPIVVEIRQDSNLRQSVSLRSVEGWNCVGYLTNEQRDNEVDSVIEVPLQCNGGITGNSLISVDRMLAKATINFSLSNGVVGTAEIG